MDLVAAVGTAVVAVIEIAVDVVADDVARSSLRTRIADGERVYTVADDESVR